MINVTFVIKLVTYKTEFSWSHFRGMTIGCISGTEKGQKSIIMRDGVICGHRTPSHPNQKAIY